MEHFIFSAYDVDPELKFGSCLIEIRKDFLPLGHDWVKHGKTIFEQTNGTNCHANYYKR